MPIINAHSYNPKLCKPCGEPRDRVVPLAGKLLDLRRLYEAVAAAGGFATVCSQKLWSVVRDQLGFESAGVSRQRSQCTLLRCAPTHATHLKTE